MAKARGMFEVECPCCGASLKLDPETRAVISHKAPERQQPRAPAAPVSEAVKAEGLVFQAGGCSRRLDKVTCSVLITNTTREPIEIRREGLGEAATVTDESGNTYLASQIFFAGQHWTRAKEEEGSRWSRRYSFHQADFHPGVPVTASYTYEGVDSSTRLAHLTQRFSGRYGRTFVVGLQNIPVQSASTP